MFGFKTAISTSCRQPVCLLWCSRSRKPRLPTAQVGRYAIARRGLRPSLAHAMSRVAGRRRSFPRIECRGRQPMSSRITANSSKSRRFISMLALTGWVRSSDAPKGRNIALSRSGTATATRS